MVTDDISVKRKVLGEAEAAVGVGTVLATTNACFSVADLAPALVRPQNMLGMHFISEARSNTPTGMDSNDLPP